MEVSASEIWKKCLSRLGDGHSVRDQYAGSYFSLFFYRSLY